MQKELMPVNQNVILDMNDDKGEQKTASGIIIPEFSQRKTKNGKSCFYL